ncbi:hypothetical protein [Shewanella woodyi]|uniref:hypothetical protein n=1 Tax=Shewanella woodyi TaxID=60961 RepID=UPI0007F90743|nr:hypothetical protein [Shewanella woodyi]
MKKQQLTCLAIITLVFTPVIIAGGDKVENVKYLAGFNTTKAYCFAFINDMQSGDNLFTSSGTVSTGFNVTPYLENGENSLSIQVVSLTAPQDLAFEPDASCEFSVTAHTGDREYKLTSVVSSVNENLKAVGTNTPEYKGSDKIGAVKEFTVNNSVLYEIRRDFMIQGLPNWAWTSASPFTPTKDNIQKLKDRYLDLWMLFSNKDVKAIGKQAELAMYELGDGDGYSAEEYWNTYGYQKEFSDGKVALPIEWSHFKFASYKDGRLFRLEDPDGNSPLQIGTPDGNDFISYNPYFSLINGKLVITR